MTDLGMMRHILCLEVDQSSAGIFLSQRMYVEDIPRKAKVMKYNPVSTPMEP